MHICATCNRIPSRCSRVLVDSFQWLLTTKIKSVCLWIHAGVCPEYKEYHSRHFQGFAWIDRHRHELPVTLAFDLSLPKYVKCTCIYRHPEKHDASYHSCCQTEAYKTRTDCHKIYLKLERGISVCRLMFMCELNLTPFSFIVDRFVCWRCWPSFFVRVYSSNTITRVKMWECFFTFT